MTIPVTTIESWNDPAGWSGLATHSTTVLPPTDEASVTEQLITNYPRACRWPSTALAAADAASLVSPYDVLSRC